MIKSKSKDGQHELEFNPKSHRYKLDGKALPSVTTIIKMLPTPEALIKWRIKQGLEEYISGKKLFRAATIGGLVHAYIEKTESGEAPEEPKGETEEDTTKIRNCISLYKNQWKPQNKDEILGLEKIVAAPNKKYGGTIDRLAKRNDKIVLSDFKTSTGIYLENFIQVAGYAIAIEEWEGISVDVLEIIRFGKEDDRPEVKIVDIKSEVTDHKEQFLRCLDTYRFMHIYQ